MAALSKERRRFLEATAAHYQAHLEVLAPILEERGVDLTHAQAEGLGAVVDPPDLHQEYATRLAIPYVTDFGIVNMSFRCVNPQCEDDGHARCGGKYQKMQGWETNLYGMRSYKDAGDWIAVTEGELDSLILRQIGIPAVAIPGASSWKPHWNNVFEDLSKVYVFSDGDSSGHKMFQNVRDQLIKNDIPVVEIPMKAGEDVNSSYLKYGPDYLLGKVKR